MNTMDTQGFSQYHKRCANAIGYIALFEHLKKYISNCIEDFFATTFVFDRAKDKIRYERNKLKSLHIENGKIIKHEYWSKSLVKDAEDTKHFFKKDKDKGTHPFEQQIQFFENINVIDKEEAAFIINEGNILRDTIAHNSFSIIFDEDSPFQTKNKVSYLAAIFTKIHQFWVNEIELIGEKSDYQGNLHEIYTVENFLKWIEKQEIEN